jgi:hypothetical protein
MPTDESESWFDAILAEDTEPQISEVHEESFKEFGPGVNTFSTSTNCFLKTPQDARSYYTKPKLARRSEIQRVNLIVGDPIDIEEETRRKEIKYVSLIRTAAFHAVSSSYYLCPRRASSIHLVTNYIHN